MELPGFWDTFWFAFACSFGLAAGALPGLMIWALFTTPTDDRGPK